MPPAVASNAGAALESQASVIGARRELSLELAIFWEPAPDGTGTYLDMLLSGLALTIETALCAWVIALAFGRWSACCARCPRSRRRWAGFAYVEFFRNMPLLVQLFLWFFVLPELLPQACGPVAEADAATRRSTRRRSASGCSCRRASPSRSRAGIGSLPRGQTMAATALGLTTAQTYRYVLLPMAFRIILPPLTSEFLNTIKNTSVAITIGLIELTGEARVDAGVFVPGVRGLHRRDRAVSR